MPSRTCLDRSAQSARGSKPGLRRWLSVALVALGVLALAPAGASAGTLDQQQPNFITDAPVAIQGPATVSP